MIPFLLYHAIIPAANWMIGQPGTRRGKEGATTLVDTSVNGLLGR